MDSKFSSLLLPADRIHSSITIEPILFVLLTAFSAYLTYKLFLKGLTVERHRNLRTQFKNLFFHCIFCTVLYIAFFASHQGATFVSGALRISPYLGLMTIIWAGIVFVKTCRILIFQYLFLRSMSVGVPLLLVNIFTLGLSLLIGAWILNTVFGFRLLPLAATSAVFSIVLGLALQDTLGNLFSGIALQLDKPYTIGDWVEIFHENQKLTGMVTEITWRATVLLSMTDEVISIPNRIVSQSQVNNYAAKNGPIIRGQFFRIPYGSSIRKAKEVLLKSIEPIQGVRRRPEPLVLVMESSESWITLKLIYYIDDFGKQFLINDEVLMSALESLDREKIVLANPRLSLTTQS